MILLRQKLYTRQDQKVIKELHKATKGFRDLPKGYKGMATRDYFRLGKFAEGFNTAFEKGNAKAIDWKEFETLAKHMSLPETAKGGKHLIEKYNNPELLERYRRIQKLRENPEQRKKIQQIEKKYIKDLDKLDKKRTDIVMRAFKEEGGKLVEDPKVIAEGYRLDAAEGRRMDKYEQDKLQQISESGAKFAKRQSDLLKKIQKKNKSYRKSPRQNKELFEELKKEAESWGYTVKVVPKGSESGGGNVAVNRKIIELTSEDPTTLAHELGHVKHDYRLGARQGKERDKILGIESHSSMDKHPIGRWEDEHGATIEGLATMKTKKSATKEDIKAAEDHLEDCFKTYYHGGLKRLPEIIARRLGKW